MAQSSPVVQVVPLVRLPRRLMVFDYQAEDLNLEIGDLVTVEFRKVKTTAVVVGLGASLDRPSRIKLKKVQSCLTKGYFLPWQIELAVWLRDSYGLTWSAALKLFVNFEPNRNFKIRSLLNLNHNRRMPVFYPTVLAYLNRNKLEQAVINLLNRSDLKKGQILFLVPSQKLLDYWFKRLAGQFSVIDFSSVSSLQSGRSLWLKLRQGDKLIVIGTRQSLFLPFSTLAGIVVDESSSEYYKQSDQYPRYDPVELAKEIARLNSVPCLSLSAAPRLEDWQAYKKGSLKFNVLKGQSARFSLVDMHSDRRAGHKGLLAEASLLKIKNNLNQGRSVFVYLNRLGETTAIICQDCGYTPLCDKCLRPLVSRINNNDFYCFHCNWQIQGFLACPKCSGHNFLKRGSGLDGLYDWLVKLQPNWPLYKEVLPKKHQTPFVLVGGQASWHNNQGNDFALAILVNPDGEKSLPEFRAAERLWRRIKYFLSVVTEETAVQTYLPEDVFWQYFIRPAGDFSYFYNKELKDRFNYQYPPATKLLRLTCLSNKESESLAKSRTLQVKLKSLLPPSIKLIGPYPDYYVQLRGKYRWHLLIKTDQEFDFKFIWPKLPDDVIIDMEPDNILS